MNPQAPEKLGPLELYAAQRQQFRDAIITHKRSHRLAVGEKVTLLFEDREPLRFQVQEMLYIERISDPARVRYEVEVYNEPMPGERELSATLFVEITEAPASRPELGRLRGIDPHVLLELGSQPACESIYANFDAKQFEDGRISAVQYIRFKLDAQQARRFQNLREPAHLRIDHPNYDRRTELQGALRQSPAQGLSADPDPLLDLSRRAPEPPPLLFETAHVHTRAAGSAGEGSVELKQAAGSFLEVDETLFAEVLEVVRRVGRPMVEKHRSCRISSTAGKGYGPRVLPDLARLSAALAPPGLVSPSGS